MDRLVVSYPTTHTVYLGIVYKASTSSGTTVDNIMIIWLYFVNMALLSLHLVSNGG